MKSNMKMPYKRGSDINRPNMEMSSFTYYDSRVPNTMRMNKRNQKNSIRSMMKSTEMGLESTSYMPIACTVSQANKNRRIRLASAVNPRAYSKHSAKRGNFTAKKSMANKSFYGKFS